jgi:Flp pilus assembly protein TadG
VCRLWGPWGNDRGAVATEFVILIPIFMTLALGMVWAGTTFFRYVNLELSARDGARYGATLPAGYPDDVDDSGNPSDAWFFAIADAVADSSLGPSEICVAYSGMLGNAVVERDISPGTTSRRYIRLPDGTGSFDADDTCFTDGRGTLPRRVQVQVEGPVPMQGFGFFDGTLRGDAVARFEAVYPED